VFVTTDSAAGAAKQVDILRAAQQLFGEVGYDKTGVREIAERAHVAIATIYSYFGTGKIGVLGAALDERVSRLVAHTLATGEAAPIDAFLDRVRRLNQELIRDPFLRRVLTEQDRVAEPRLRERGHEIVNLFASVAIQDLRNLVAAGHARCDDPEAVATLLRVATEGWALADRAGEDQVSHDRMLETLLAAVRALITAT
jgi:AcrR family transcriptional regulator